MISKTEYTYNNSGTVNNDSVYSVTKILYRYNGIICTGYTQYTNNVRTILCDRTMQGNYNYTDSIYAYIQPGDIQSNLTSVKQYFYSSGYKLDSTHNFRFYDIRVNIAKETKKITVYLAQAGHADPYTLQLMEDEHPREDVYGNRIEDVFSYNDGDTQEYEISRYEYEYY